MTGSGDEQLVPVRMPEPVKAGWRTTEFWLACTTAVLGGAIVLPAGAAPWRVVCGSLLALLPVIRYQLGRERLKLEAAAPA